MIPEAAVEAAAKALYEASLTPMEDDGEGPPYAPMSWDRMDGAYRNATYVFPMRAALEAAAPHMLVKRTVTTVEELDGLAFGSVVLDGDVCVRRGDGYWKVSDLAGVYASGALTLPASVLYEPTP